MYRPTHIFYMNTISCNQKCTKCSHWKHSDSTSRLPIKKLVNAIRSIPSVQELCIVGGEPLLFKDEILRIINGISGLDIRTVIITNGVLMDDSFIHAVSNQNVHIVVSIDTMDKKFWNYVRGSDSFKVVMNNVEYASEIFHPGQLSIQSVLAEETRVHVPEVARFAREKNLYHSIQYYLSDGFGGSWTPVKQPYNQKSEHEQKCFAANRNLSIMQNGDVYTCFQQTQINGCENALGNIHVDEMSKILGSEYAASIGDRMKSCNLPCRVLKCNVKSI